MAGVEPYGIFININNTLYVADRQNSRIQIWFEGNINPNKTISGGMNTPLSLFATLSGDIYVDNSFVNDRIDKWSINANKSVIVMTNVKDCYSIFVDINNTLYCTMTNYHQVVKKWLDDGMITSTIAAGSNSPGATPNKLNSPRGIFVSTNFDLYVADCNNDRVQLFQLGQLNATTVAGNQVSQTITLSCPTGVVLDADNYLFIVDSGNHRIIGSGPTGFRCLVGCFGSGSAPNQLYYPQSMAFDSYGNIFVTDRNNSRVQKFVVATNSCSKYGSTKLS